MALINCSECNTEISDKAISCPKCGAPQKLSPQVPAKKTSWLVQIGGSIILLCVGFAIVGAFNSKPPAEAGSQDASTGAARETLRITAADLWKAYDINEVAADEKMKGKFIEVSGKLESIDKDFMDKPVLHLATGNQFMSAGMALKDSDRSKSATLRRGQGIIVRCEHMQRIVGSPQGSDCQIVQP